MDIELTIIRLQMIVEVFLATVCAHMKMQLVKLLTTDLWCERVSINCNDIHYVQHSENGSTPKRKTFTSLKPLTLKLTGTF